MDFLNFITIHNYFCDLCKFYLYMLVIFSQIMYNAGVMSYVFSVIPFWVKV